MKQKLYRFIEFYRFSKTDNEINNKYVCDKLRLFINDLYSSNSISLNEALEYICNLGQYSEKKYSEYWVDFFNISVMDELTSGSGIYKNRRNEFLLMFKDYLSTGIYEDLCFNNTNRKKFFVKSGIIVFIYSILILGLFCLLAKPLLDLFPMDFETFIAIFVTILVILIVPPVVILVVGKDFVYDLFSRSGKEERRKRKKELEIIKNRIKKDSFDIRGKYQLPSYILTDYEHTLKYPDNELPTKKRLIFMIIIEVFALIFTLGSPIYFNFWPVEISVAVLLFGLAVGIYGFCILLNKPFKGIIYSVLPVLCYFVPLVIIYYFFNCKIEWILGLGTILMGSMLFAIFMIITTMPIRDYNKLEREYNIKIVEKYQYDKLDYIDSYQREISFYLEDEYSILIQNYGDKNCRIFIFGDVIYKNVLLKKQIIDFKEFNIDYEKCISEGLEILSSYKK